MYTYNIYYIYLLCFVVFVTITYNITLYLLAKSKKENKEIKERLKKYYKK